MATAEQTSTGVSFALTDEQKELRTLARSFAANEIRPKAAEYDEHSTHPVDVIAKAHALGLMNLHVPEAYGGLGLASFDGMLVGEELNWGCSGIGTSIGANSLGAGPVIIAGSDEQKARWLPPLLEEPILCSFGLSEPGAGSDVARMGTTAERRGDEYVLNGLEDLHHERRSCRVDGRLRQDRPGEGPPRHLGVRRADGHPRGDDREAPRQDGPALDRHIGVRARRRGRPRGQPAG